MNKIIFTLFLTIGLYAQIVDGVAIVVKGSAITLYDIKKEMSFTNTNAKNAAESLIRKKLEELEVIERGITASSDEIYKDIKQAAARNKMSVSDFYEAVRNSNGMSSTELKKQIKQKILSQKLYSSIAYSSLSQPDDVDIEEYYKLHINEFTKPSDFEVIIHMAKSKARLQEKIDNPMFYSPDIQTNEQNLSYSKISKKLAKLLEETPLNSFSQIIPDSKGGFMSFYLKSAKFKEDGGFNNYKDQIISKIMASQREQVLGEYFTRLRLSADIKQIRMPE